MLLAIKINISVNVIGYFCKFFWNVIQLHNLDGDVHGYVAGYIVEIPLQQNVLRCQAQKAKKTNWLVSTLKKHWSRKVNMDHHWNDPWSCRYNSTDTIIITRVSVVASKAIS